jgi:hypothetical protein
MHPEDGRRPLLFLDVDGVLNVWAPQVPVHRWFYPDGRLASPGSMEDVAVEALTRFADSCLQILPGVGFQG